MQAYEKITCKAYEKRHCLRQLYIFKDASISLSKVMAVTVLLVDNLSQNHCYDRDQAIIVTKGS